MGKKIIRNSIEHTISAEELFTDREEPRKAFWDKYEDMGPGEFDVISYFGVGGVGKSALLKKLGREIEEKKKKENSNILIIVLNVNLQKKSFYTLFREK